MEDNSNSEESQFISIGEFSPPHAVKVTDLFESLDVAFEVEFDDSEIRNLTPADASFGGTYGHGAKVRIFVAADKIEHARVVIEELFPA